MCEVSFGFDYVGAFNVLIPREGLLYRDKHLAINWDVVYFGEYSAPYINHVDHVVESVYPDDRAVYVIKWSYANSWYVVYWNVADNGTLRMSLEPIFP